MVSKVANIDVRTHLCLRILAEIQSKIDATDIKTSHSVQMLNAILVIFLLILNPIED